MERSISGTPAHRRNHALITQGCIDSHAEICSITRWVKPSNAPCLSTQHNVWQVSRYPDRPAVGQDAGVWSRFPGTLPCLRRAKLFLLCFCLLYLCKLYFYAKLRLLHRFSPGIKSACINLQALFGFSVKAKLWLRIAPVSFRYVPMDLYNCKTRIWLKKMSRWNIALYPENRRTYKHILYLPQIWSIILVLVAWARRYNIARINEKLRNFAGGLKTCIR